MHLNSSTPFQTHDANQGAIATKALILNTGVRALTRIVNDSLREIEFQLPELALAGISQITITEDTIRDRTSFISISSPCKTQSLYDWDILNMEKN